MFARFTGSAMTLAFTLTQAALAEEIKFAWPVPSTVTVTEETLKKGQTGKMRYDIVMSKEKGGNNYELNFKNFEFLELQGLDLSDPENREKAGPGLKHATALGGMLPTLIIAPEGTVEDVVGMEKCVDSAVSILTSADPKLIEVLKSPEMIAQMKQKSVDFWRVWVETWLVAPEDGKEKSIEMEVPMFGEMKVKAPLVVRNEGRAGESGGNVRLTAETVLAGEEARKALATMMQNMVAKLPVKEGVKPFSPDMVKSVKRVTTFTVVTNPKTLQPTKASSISNVEINIDDKSKSEIESHKYEFNWPKSGD